MRQFAGFLFDLKIMPRHRPKAPASCRKMKQRRKWERETEGYGKEPKADRRKLRVGRGRSGASAAPRRTKCVKREGAGNTPCGPQQDGRRQYAFRFPKFLASFPFCALPVRGGRAAPPSVGPLPGTHLFFDHDSPLRLAGTPADPDLRLPKVGTFRVLPFAHKSHPDFIYFI